MNRVATPILPAIAAAMCVLLTLHGGPVHARVVDDAQPSAPAATTTPTSTTSTTSTTAPPATIGSTTVAAPSTTPPAIRALRLTLADAAPGEVEQLERFLHDVVGRPAAPSSIELVVDRLRSLRRYAASVCEVVPRRSGPLLTCALQRARVVRTIRIETADVGSASGVSTGLPVALLEADLRKRMFLRPGESIDDEVTEIGRQRARIQDYLEREGFTGAVVELDAVPVADTGEVDLVVRVRGGSFLRVRRVDVQAWGPLSQNALVEGFSRMCLTSEGFLDGVFLGNLTSCFNDRRVRATVARFEHDLHAAGFPEGRVRVVPTLVDPRAHSAPGDDDDCLLPLRLVRAFSAQNLPLPHRCVDLRVDVVPGPNLVSRFHLDEQGARPIVEAPELLEGTWLWFRDNLREPLGRSELSRLAFGDDPAHAADTELVGPRLRAQLTFASAASTDEAEQELSAEHLRSWLGRRGYPTADVRAQRTTYDDGAIAVDWWLRPGAPAVVRRVRIIGNGQLTAEDILDGVELAAQPRSLTSAGTLSPDDLDDDVERLRAFYEQQGFREANVRAFSTRGPDGDLDVTFVVDEGERFVIHDIVLAGGDPELTPEVLGALAHCDGGRAARAGVRPRVTADCDGTPFRPEELEADEQRVMNVYAAWGYPHVEARVELGFGSRGPLLRVSVFPHGADEASRADPQPGNVQRLRLGEIFVEGNVHTQHDVLLREAGLLDVKEGARLDPARLAAGVGRLRKTALFSRVELDYLGVDDGDDLVHARISVEERAAATVDLSLGASSQDLFSLRAEARDRNLFGTMFDGSAALDFGLFIGRASQLRTQVRWPRMFGSNVSLSFTPLLSTYRDAPAGLYLTAPSTTAGQSATSVFARPDARRRLLSSASSIALDWRAADLHPAVDDKLSIGGAVEARADWLDVAGPYFSPGSAASFASLDGLLALVQTQSPTTVLAFTPRIAWSDIDNPLDPTSGTASELFFRAAPFGRVPYGILGAAGRGFLTIGERLTLAGNVHVRLGVAEPKLTCAAADTQRCEWSVLQNDLLFPGGERSVRGVAQNSVGVTGLSYDGTGTLQLDDQGVPIVKVRPGMWGAVANLEARWSLVRNLFIGDLKPAIFTDLAYSGDDFSGSSDSIWNDTRIAMSVGAGLRYVLPVGPLAIDVAWSPFRPPGSFPVGIYGYLGYIF